jgi:hypothetical protein
VAGDQSVRPEIAAEEETKASLNVDFTAYVLAHNYDLFGTLGAQ